MCNCWVWFAASVALLSVCGVFLVILGHATAKGKKPE